MITSADVRGEYRYSLRRSWGEGAYQVLVMLNPSTADATTDDPTIRRCIGFAQRDGFGGLIVLNLFALRATDPHELQWHADPIGPRNDAILEQVLLTQRLLGQPVLAAWGASGPSGLAKRVADVKALVPDVHWQHLGLTKTGQPRHPLYLRADTERQDWIND